MRIDLHTHSAVSDGTDSPAELVAAAAAARLAVVALTDHDTFDGLPEALAAGQRLGIEVVPGMELSCSRGGQSVHLLAYGADPGDADLAAEMALVRDGRSSRLRPVLAKLAELGVPVTEESVLSFVGGSPSVGRPHIADALVAAGYYADRGAAFAEVLHPRSPYYVPTYAIETVDAIRMVREAGGLAVLAHPAAGRMTRSVDVSALEEFVAAGLWGIELDHPENRDDWIAPLTAFAKSNGLHITGASDYHGAGKDNRLGERTSSLETWNAIRSLVTVPR